MDGCACRRRRCRVACVDAAAEPGAKLVEGVKDTKISKEELLKEDEEG